MRSRLSQFRVMTGMAGLPAVFAGTAVPAQDATSLATTAVSGGSGPLAGDPARHPGEPYRELHLLTRPIA
ncbi:hypothetical protein GCM10023334_089910 [Nonomuraea thailandensis]